MTLTRTIKRNKPIYILKNDAIGGEIYMTEKELGEVCLLINEEVNSSRFKYDKQGCKDYIKVFKKILFH